MYAAHASTVSAIRVGYYSAANARATDEAAAFANRNEATSYRFEEAGVEDVDDDSAAEDVWKHFNGWDISLRVGLLLIWNENNNR